MDQHKEVLRKGIALIVFLVIALGVFLVAPPASRLIVALIALPIEAWLLMTLFSDNRERGLSGSQ